MLPFFTHILIHFAELLRLLPSSSSVSCPVSNFSWEVVVTARPAQPNQTLYLRPLEKKLAERWLNRAQPKTSGFPSTPDKSPHKHFEGLAWMVSETLSTNNSSQSANHESDEALIGVTWKLFHSWSSEFGVIAQEVQKPDHFDEQRSRYSIGLFAESGW